MSASPTGPGTTRLGTEPPRGGRGGGGRRGGFGWLLPAVTFLVGLAVGGLLTWTIRPVSGQAIGSSSGVTGASPSPSGAATALTPGPSPAAVTVPVSCLQLADDVRRATELLDGAAVAARAMDTSRLADLVRRMGQVSDTFDARATSCRDAASPGEAAVTTEPDRSPHQLGPS